MASCHSRVGQGQGKYRPTAGSINQKIIPCADAGALEGAQGWPDRRGFGDIGSRMALSGGKRDDVCARGETVRAEIINSAAGIIVPNSSEGVGQTDHKLIPTATHDVHVSQNDFGRSRIVGSILLAQGPHVGAGWDEPVRLERGASDGIQAAEISVHDAKLNPVPAGLAVGFYQDG